MLLRNGLAFALVAPQLLTGCLGASEFSPVRRALTVTRAASDLEQVTTTPEHELDPSVSRDGARVAFAVLDRPDAQPRVEVLALGSGARTRLGDATDVLAKPSWTDDRHVLVAARATGSRYSRAAVYDVVQPRPPTLLARAWSNVDTVSASVAPNAPRFVQEVTADVFGWYSATRYDVHILVVSDVDGVGRSEISQARTPAFSPNGRLIAYVGLGDRIYLADGITGKPIYYLMPGDSPSWSPDGNWIAFCAPGDDGGKDIFVVGPDGRGMRPLTRGTGEACHPTWSTDGWIYFHANASGNFDVWRMRPHLGE